LWSVSCITVVVSFFIAGLLVSRASSASITWELNASRWRPAFSSHLYFEVFVVMLVSGLKPDVQAWKPDNPKPK